MKKLLILIMLIVSGSVSVMSQNTIVNSSDNKAYFGVRVGGEVTCPSNVTVGNLGVDLFNNGGGINFGGVYNVPLVANLYIEPGLSFYYNKYSMNEDFMFDFTDGAFDRGSYSKFGMRVPVVAGYHFDFTNDIKVSVFTGPELEIGLSAKERIKGDYIEVSNNLYGKEGDLNRVNLLWRIGAGISFKNYYFEVNGGIGMLNLLKDSDGKFHENHVTFSLGYNF